MSSREKIEEIISNGEKLEKKYTWFKAAELYEQALGVVGRKDFSRLEEVQERIAYCLYRAAFQSETQEEFKNRMLEAVKAREKTAEFYEKVDQAKGLYSTAMALFAKWWTPIDASQKKEILNDCARLLKETMKAFEESGDHFRYGKACNDLLWCLWDTRNFEWDWTEKKRRLEEALEYGDTAISTLSKVGDERELARAYLVVGLHSMTAGFGELGEEKREKFIQKALSHAEKALQLSKKTGDAYLESQSNWLAAATQLNFTGNLELSLEHGEESLQQAKKTKDRVLIGLALWGLILVTNWAMAGEEDPNKKRKGLERMIQHAEEAVPHLLTVCRYDILTFVYAYYSESHYFLAHEVETDPKERRNLLERAIEIGRKGLEYAEQSAGPYISYVHHALSKVFYSLSELETQITGKRRLLEEASKHREESITLTEQTESPFNYWDHGVMQNYAALIKAALAAIETDKEKKKDLLEEAVSRMEKCVTLCIKWTTIYPQQTYLFAVVGWYSGWFGGILNQLYSITKEEKTLEKVIKVYQDTAEAYLKAELPSRVAEAHWHLARLYDQLGEHAKAERSFQSASENYKLAATKIPQLKEFYTDHASYMQAWSEIEKAKHNHSKNQHGLARDRYEKAASLHESTEQWNYLSPNYLALALVEEAENVSRIEQTEEAKDLFQQAADLFVRARKSIEVKLEKIESKNEKKMAAELINASDVREQYCLGRIALEEAKMLDRQGDHAGSSGKYQFATQKFQKAIDSMKRESDRRELRPIVALCRAWQAMTRAEAEASPDLYLEASQLFDEAKKHSFDEKAKVLALGHSSFCKALEAGTRFETTREQTMYSTAKKHLEAAANHYVKAGFKNASEYARATHRLFDAYMYTHKAETETDPAKKAQFYKLVERLLQASSGSYMKAKHPEKSEEVGRLLESIKEERQLAVSLSEVLHAPTIASTTSSFSTPTPTHEKAVGLERFERADIQANLLLRVTEVNVGEDIDFKIELVNAGKAPALLIKVDEIVPAGFEIKEVPESYAVEDSFLNMKGRRLNPLKTEDVKIVLKPRSKGTFPIRPRILYIDETGKYKSHEPEPVTITVKELGISGWIKGER